MFPYVYRTGYPSWTTLCRYAAIVRGVPAANSDTLAVWLSGTTGRVVTWYNQAPLLGSTVDTSGVGTAVWPSETSPLCTSTTNASQPIVDSTLFPTYNGWGTTTAGVLYVKYVRALEITREFTVMMWVRAAAYDTSSGYNAYFSLGIYNTGILMRSDVVLILGQTLTNSALSSYISANNTWAHVALTRDANNTVSFWVNGTVRSTRANPASLRLEGRMVTIRLARSIPTPPPTTRRTTAACSSVSAAILVWNVGTGPLPNASCTGRTLTSARCNGSLRHSHL